VVACLEKRDPVILDEVNKPMLPGDAPGPRTGVEVLQGLRFSDTAKWIAQRGLNQSQHSQSCLAFRLDPIFEVFAKIIIENAKSRLLATPIPGQVQALTSAQQGSPAH